MSTRGNAEPAFSRSGPQSMPDPAKAELLRALARLVRGLSALFWGLPLMLVVYVQTARTDWLDFLGEVGMGSVAMLPSIMVTVLLFYGLAQMRHFQPQERIWIRALDRAQVLVFVNLGLVPFLYWWHKMPQERLFSVAVAALAFSSILLLFNVNYVLQRLAAMLPDEMLRAETNLFTAFNRYLLACIPVIVAGYFILNRATTPPPGLIAVLAAVEDFGHWFLLFLVLMPLAMTMALIWKIKEVIFLSVFEGQ